MTSLITNILEQYADKDIVRVEQLSGGSKNAGIYKLCRSGHLDKIKQLLQEKILELQQKLGKEKKNIKTFYTDFLAKNTVSKMNMIRTIKDASALLVTGIVTYETLFKELQTNFKHFGNGRVEIRFQSLKELKSLKIIGEELKQMSVEQVTKEEYIDTLYSQLTSLGGISTIDPRIQVDISYQNLLKKALEDTCPYILKLDSNKGKIQSEIDIQKMVNEINPDITPRVIDADIKTFSNGVANLYGFAMELIHGRPICEGCPDGMEISFSVAQNQYKGFSRDNTDQLITIMQELHDKDIVHNDLNLENIIISPSGKVKIIDWGESKSSSSDQDKLDEIHDDTTGLYTRICSLLERATKPDAKARGAQDYTQTLKYLLNRLDEPFGGEARSLTSRCPALGKVEDGNSGDGSGGSSSKKGGGKRKTKRNKKRYKTRRGRKRNTKRKTKHRVSRKTKRREKNN